MGHFQGRKTGIFLAYGNAVYLDLHGGYKDVYAVKNHQAVHVRFIYVAECKIYTLINKKNK